MTLVGAVLASSAIAQAATKHHVRQTSKLSALFQSATYPNPGSKDVDVGTLSGKPAGGALVQHITITGHPSTTTYTFKGTATDFYAHGTTRTSFSGVATAQPNGVLTVTGHGITQAVRTHIVVPAERSHLLEPRHRPRQEGRPHWWPT